MAAVTSMESGRSLGTFRQSGGHWVEKYVQFFVFFLKKNSVYYFFKDLHFFFSFPGPSFFLYYISA